MRRALLVRGGLNNCVPVPHGSTKNHILSRSLLPRSITQRQRSTCTASTLRHTTPHHRIRVLIPSPLSSLHPVQIRWLSSTPSTAAAVASPRPQPQTQQRGNNEPHLTPSQMKMMAADRETLQRIRNIAIIAHVDHGKTTLVDCLLKQSGTLHGDLGERIMDSNALERERGITILSKVTSILWRDTAVASSAAGTSTKGEISNLYQINIVDTPGHADFGGEVERVLSMVDGVILVVDATDGPMTQTKFVLTKALRHRLNPLVIFNKVDRPSSRIGEIENEVFDLFVALDASDEQMEYPMVYTSAREGWATEDPKVRANNMDALFRRIVRSVPPPRVDLQQPFSMLITQIESDKFLGKCLLGRISSGTVSLGDTLQALDPQGHQTEQARVIKLLCRRGVEKVQSLGFFFPPNLFPS